MKIELTDIFDGGKQLHEVEMTTDHPASHYGLPVMVFGDGGCCNAESWILGKGEVVKATADEQKLFAAWYKQLSLLLSN